MASSTIIPNSDIVLRRDGVGDRAIVFMHGWIDDMHVWRPVIDELSAPGFETVQLDLAGFGDRTESNGPFTFDRFAADVLAVVDAVDKPFVLVGHSMAAPIVELVAAARPERALGLVLSGSHSDGRNPVARRGHGELPIVSRRGGVGDSGHASASGAIGP